MEQPHLHPLELLESKGKYLNIAAPMVRYSKLAFRETVRKYNVDLCFTPMILSDVFRNSQLSRDAELIISETDKPLIVQFAASNGKDAADAAEMIAPFTNGVDINCGCPQPWAFKERIGSYLSSHPEITEDIVKQIRIDKDLRNTVELCQRAQAMGADFITVHGRLKSQKNEGHANLEAIKLIKEHLSIPVFGNGGIDSIEQADRMVAQTNVDGVMVAQGLLSNPAMFAGFSVTPNECIREFIESSLSHPSSSSNFFIFHHHLSYMLENRIKSKAERTHFRSLQSTAAVLDYLERTT